MKQLFDNYRQLVSGAEWIEQEVIEGVWKWIKSAAITWVEKNTK
jgi:hypothetical protein